jgi:hypothetical protein
MDADYCRRRAQFFAEAAAQMSDPKSRAQLIDMAEYWVEATEAAEARERVAQHEQPKRQQETHNTTNQFIGGHQRLLFQASSYILPTNLRVSIVKDKVPLHRIVKEFR